ncbi:MAG TPA: SdpI family protein [Saprospiraceae bacterium]|nr:SdpI family protein [Saprospiraceae bacterium]
MNKYVKEIVLWALIVLPYVYLAIIWNKLPDVVPIHFNLAGNADDWSSKTTLLFLPGALGLGIYLLMLFIPALDPKRKIQQMGGKYYSLRLMLTFFFSVLTIYILYITQTGSLEKPNMLIALIGALFAMFGNYFQTIRPNYFVGIRTPWTLENEQVWKKTHRLAGRLWMPGGALIVLISFIVNSNLALAIIFGVILFFMVIVPVVYSYTEFQKEKIQSQ